MSKFHPKHDGLSSEFMDRLVASIGRTDAPQEVNIGSAKLIISIGFAGEVSLHNDANNDSVALTEHNAHRVVNAVNDRFRQLEHLAASKRHSFNEL